MKRQAEQAKQDRFRMENYVNRSMAWRKEKKGRGKDRYDHAGGKVRKFQLVSQNL